MRLHRPFGKLPDTTGSMLGSDNRRYTTIRTDHPPFVESVNRIHKHSMGLTIHLESTWTMLRHTRQGQSRTGWVEDHAVGVQSQIEWPEQIGT